MFIDISTWKVGGALPANFKVEDQHPDYQEMLPHWKKCRDARNGSKAIKAGGTKYLPRLESQEESNTSSGKTPEQKTKEYDNYKNRGIWYDAVGQTVESFNGMIHAKPATYNISKKEVEKILQDSDMFKYASQDEESFPALMKACTDEILTVNRVGILEDYPVQIGPDGKPIEMSVLEAENKKISSYSIMYKAEQIVNWGTATLKGRKVESFYNLEESWFDYEDSFTSPAKRKRWRILVLDAYEFIEADGEILKVERAEPIYKQITVSEKKSGTTIDSIETPLIDGKPFNSIPFWCLNVYGNKADGLKEPEILGLVEMNIGHYRNSADREYELHYVAMKTPIFPGYNKDVIKDYGPPVLGNAVGVPMESKPYIMEAQSISGLDGEMVKKEERMAVLGSQMLAQRGRYVQAAKTAEIQGQGESGILGSLSIAVEQAFSEILTLKLKWSGQKDITASITLNKEYMKNTINPDMLKDLVQAVQAGKMSFKVFFYNVNKLGMYPDKWTEENELQAIENEGLGASSQEIFTSIDSLNKRISGLEGKGATPPDKTVKPGKGAAA